MLPTKPTFYGKQKQPLTFAIVSGFDDMSPHLEGFPTTITLKLPKKKKMKVLNLRGLRAGFYVANPLCFQGDFFFVRWILESTLFRMSANFHHVCRNLEPCSHQFAVRKPITEQFVKHGWSTYTPQATYPPQKYGFHTAVFLKGTNDWLKPSPCRKAGHSWGNYVGGGSRLTSSLLKSPVVIIRTKNQYFVE